MKICQKTKMNQKLKNYSIRQCKNNRKRTCSLVFSTKLEPLILKNKPLMIKIYFRHLYVINSLIPQGQKKKKHRKRKRRKNYSSKTIGEKLSKVRSREKRQLLKVKLSRNMKNNQRKNLKIECN